MKIKIIVALSCCLSLAGQPFAFAHAHLSASNPLKSQVITSIPDWIWVEFDGDLMEFGGKQINTITVTNSKKQRVDVGGSVVGGARLSTKIKSNLSPGIYFVNYRIVSNDGHPVTGSYQFTYKVKN